MRKKLNCFKIQAVNVLRESPRLINNNYNITNPQITGTNRGNFPEISSNKSTQVLQFVELVLFKKG